MKMARKIKKSRFFFEENFIETIGEVSQNKYKPLKNNEKLKYLGKKISRIDGYDKASGTAVFTFDIDLPGITYAKTLRSPYANAKIKNIDDSKARKLKGVYEIIHYKNAPKIKWYYGSSFLFDQHVRYEGDEVACVVADSEELAEKAIGLISVEYEILPHATRAEEAMRNKVKIHKSGNIVRGKPGTYERGDINKGFEEADLVFEDEFSTEVAIHNPTEVHCSVVNWEGDKLIVWDSTQAVFGVRNSLAQSLGIPESNIRVIKKYMGGGFGSKLEAGKYTVMAALLAQKIGKPVKIALDRRENNLAVGNRPDSVQKLKGGVKSDGTLTALSHYSYSSVGAYPAGGGCSWPLRTMYKCPNVKVEEYSVYTNTGRGRPFRAPGHVQGIFALDSFMDELAEKIGMDPLEFRLKNYTKIDQVSGRPYSTKLLKECYKKGAKKIDWNKRNKIPGSGKGYLKRGIGMASQIWWGGGGPPAYVTLKLNQDGSVNILAGTQDLGTGTYTFIAQVAAEILEIPIENIDVTIGDTDVVPYGPGSGGSTTAPSIAPAVRDAAEQMKKKLFSGAAAILNVEQNEINYNSGKFYSKKDKKELIGINKIIRKMHERVLVTTGAREANNDNYMVQSFGAQFAEVEVDTLIGNVKVLKIVAAHDIGRTLNRQTLENQFHGGILQGLGFALMEEQIVDEYTGKILNANMHDYKMPTIYDVPEIEVVIVSEGDKIANNMGVKGIGEPAIIPTAGAIANAVYNAIGVRIKSLPLTPDKIIDSLYS